jgi:hypothetical protein
MILEQHRGRRRFGRSRTGRTLRTDEGACRRTELGSLARRGEQRSRKSERQGEGRKRECIAKDWIVYVPSDLPGKRGPQGQQRISGCAGSSEDQSVRTD